MKIYGLKYFFAVGLVMLLLAGCGEPSKERVMEQLKPEGDETYSVHLFYKNVLPDSETKELNVFHNSNPDRTNAIRKVQFWDVDLERDRKWAKALGIRDFPMYLILDSKGIVYQTPYLSDLKAFLEKSLLQQ